MFPKKLNAAFDRPFELKFGVIFADDVPLAVEGLSGWQKKLCGFFEMKDSGPKYVDERRDVFVPPESAKRLLCFQESRRRPAHGHVHIAIVGDPSAYPSHHGVRGLNHVGGGQAARQFASDPKSVDREQFLQSLKQAGGGVRMLGLQMLGMRFEFLDAGVGVAFERLRHYPAGACSSAESPQVDGQGIARRPRRHAG